MAAIKNPNEGKMQENQDISLINKSVKEERTYNIFDSEKDRKIWELEIENLKKKREAAKKSKSDPQENEIENAVETDPEMREIIVRELINYLILSYEVTKKFPVCLGKDGYYYELLLDYLSDLDKKVQEKENEKGKENANKLDQLAFNENINKKRKEKEAEAENEIDALAKKREMNGKEPEDKAQQKAENQIDKIIKDNSLKENSVKAIKKEPAKHMEHQDLEQQKAHSVQPHKVRVQLKKVNKERDNGRTV